MPTTDDFETAIGAATSAFAITRKSTAAERSTWLRAAADGLDRHVEELIVLADEETRLGLPRLRGEVKRTSDQLRLFASVVVDGGYLEAVIDRANPTATPPTPDLRRMLIPLGPVAVFSASNFPFAFSVAGGDTASAIAAGCSVIVKAHSGHPGLSARVTEVVTEALSEAGAPDGILSLITGRENGVRLVAHPAITAVGFTGSLHGGRALFDVAAGRPDPIPFYGELGSLNPVVLTAASDRARAAELAGGLAGSFQLGLGQFCTKPGLVFIPAGGQFEAALADAVSESTTGELLTEGIAEAFRSGSSALAEHENVRPLHPALNPDADSSAAGRSVSSTVLVTDIAAIAADPDALLEECFGPLTLLVRYTDEADVRGVLDGLGGTLTATLHSEPEEDVDQLLSTLEMIAGRVLFSGWPTGVAVTWAQHHGGPWPSTTSVFTSVGATAIRRFVRPIAYQSAPGHLLPPELRDDNEVRIPRRVDGVLTFG